MSSAVRAKKSKSLGKLAGRAGITEAIKADGQLDAGVHTRATGPDGPEGPQNFNALNVAELGRPQAEAPEDLFPHRMDLSRPDVDEAMRDEISMVAGGLYGQDKIGGVRTQNGKRLKVLLARPHYH